MQGGLGGGTVSMRPGIDAGESYVREVAAYLLVRYIHTKAKEKSLCFTAGRRAQDFPAR